MKSPWGIKAKHKTEVNRARRQAAAMAICALGAIAALSSITAAAEDELPPISGESEAPPPPETPPPDASAGGDSGGSPIAPPGESPPTAPVDAGRSLPQIEARNFTVRSIKKSTSGKTYLFDDLTDARTQVGKLVLLRREPDPTTIPSMAFRVVKLYPDKHQFAAKRVRRYGTTRALDAGATFTALEKVGDVLITQPSAQDNADLRELESGAPLTAPPVGAPPASSGTEPDTAGNAQQSALPLLPPESDTTSGTDTLAPPPSNDEALMPPPTSAPSGAEAFDSDLDAGNAPPPGSDGVPLRSENSEEDEEGSDESRFGASVEESPILDRHRHWLSAGAGYFKDSKDRYFKAAGLRYGFSLARMLFLKRPGLQDSIVAEGGAYVAKLLKFPEGNEDSYTVVPVIATLRYNLQVSESFAFFVQAGLMENIVAQVRPVNGDGTVTEQQRSIITEMHTPVPAIGGGFLFRVGPSWFVRVDLGFDSLQLGLTLRF